MRIPERTDAEDGRHQPNAAASVSPTATQQPWREGALRRRDLDSIHETTGDELGRITPPTLPRKPARWPTPSPTKRWRALSPLSRGAGEELCGRRLVAPLPHHGRGWRPPDQSPGGARSGSEPGQGRRRPNFLRAWCAPGTLVVSPNKGPSKGVYLWFRPT
jgi:hypothetical protein